MTTGLSLFSGAGGGALALTSTGHDLLACIDADKDACSTLSLNGLPVLQADVKTFDWSPFAGVDIIVGGPPCQPFSAATKGAGFSDPRDCIPDFVRAVTELRPRVFVMENVRGLLSKKHAGYLDLVVSSFPSEYHIDYKVLNAADYGVPQARQRVFVIGRLYSDPVWPVPTHTKDGTPRWVSLAEGLDITEGPDWIFTRPSTTIVGSFRPEVLAAPGWRKKGDPPRQDTPNSFVATQAQRAVLQAFPRGWRFAGSKTSVDKQLGNACPPPLLQAVITAQETFEQVHAAQFQLAVRNAWRDRKGPVTVGSQLGDHTLDDLRGKRCFLTADHLTGFALDDGDLQNVFNVGPQGRGAAAVAHAVAQGAVTLDCFEPFLPDWYGRQGWTVERYEDNWTPGGPRVAYMTHPPVAESIRKAA